MGVPLSFIFIDSMIRCMTALKLLDIKNIFQFLDTWKQKLQEGLRLSATLRQCWTILQPANCHRLSFDFLSTWMQSCITAVLEVLDVETLHQHSKWKLPHGNSWSESSPNSNQLIRTICLPHFILFISIQTNRHTDGWQHKLLPAGWGKYVMTSVCSGNATTPVNGPLKIWTQGMFVWIFTFRGGSMLKFSLFVPVTLFSMELYISVSSQMRGWDKLFLGILTKCRFKCYTA